MWWRSWLNDRPFTTLFVDGNHEIFDLLNAYPVENWHGGKIHRIAPSIIHLMRGQLFDIEGKSFFTMGGAESHDREFRTIGISNMGAGAFLITKNTPKHFPPLKSANTKPTML